MERLQGRCYMQKRVIIVGSGPAGYTAAIYLARAGLSPCLITGTEVGGQLIQTSSIENWPGAFNYPSGFELMDSLEKHVRQLDVEIINDTVQRTDFSTSPYLLIGESDSYTADAVIIATGSSAKYLGLESENRFIGSGISACATCDGFFYRNKEVAVIGGGNTAITDAIYLAGICKKVNLIHRRDTFRAEKVLTDKIMALAEEGKIVLHLDSVPVEFMGEDHLEGLTVKNTKTEGMKYIAVDGVFVAIGHKPNTDFIDPVIDMHNGYIITNRKPYSRTSTNVPGIFAAGDVADEIYQQAITSAATGCMAAIDAEKYLNSLSAD